jgi:hypothetical protein
MTAIQGIMCLYADETDIGIAAGLAVGPIDQKEASRLVVLRHYLHRRPPISHAYGLFLDGDLCGVCTFGVPPSRHLQMSACPTRPSSVIELNRLWVDDTLGRNTESWFVSRCLKLLPAFIVVSYADTAWKHRGYIYRALSWRFAGVTDEERKTPRFDYLCPGKHTREAFRSGDGANSQKVRRLPKYKYWTVTGNRRDKRALLAASGWPDKPWSGYDSKIDA